MGVECWHNGLLHSLDGCGEQRESATSTFLQLMCLFAFCICFFCWKGAQHCCYYIFTTNMHFPGQEENTMFSQQIKLAFCRAVCKSSLFHPTLLMNYFFQRLICPLTRHFSYIPLQGSPNEVFLPEAHISPYKAFQAMHNFKVKLLQPCLHLYTTQLAIILEVMGAVKRPVNFVGIKSLTFVRVLPWHKPF